MTKGRSARLVARVESLIASRNLARSVARTCRQFGWSRKTFYKWKKRLRGARRSQRCAIGSRAPHRSPARHAAGRRQQDSLSPPHVPLRAPPDRRLPEAVSPEWPSHRPPASHPGKHGLSRLPANQKHRSAGKRWQRYEKAQPGHRLQLDVKFLERIPGTRKRLYQFTAIDDCTRSACSRSTSPPISARRSSSPMKCCKRLPVWIHDSDGNGAEFQSQFHWHLRRWTSATCTSAHGRRAQRQG